MGGKKKSGGAKKGGESDAQTGNDPGLFLKNYNKMCRDYGIKPNSDIVDIFNQDDPPVCIAVDAELRGVDLLAVIDALAGAKEGLGGPYDMITTIRLWRSFIGNEGCRALGEYIKASKLTFLELLDCKIEEDGCKYIGDAIMRSKTLETLKVDHNSFGSSGLRKLSEGICCNSSLKRLSLNYCDIDHTGGRSIKNLMSCTKLEQINLTGNRLGGDGVKAFTRALGKNNSLLSLDISNNSIGPDIEALGGLARAIKDNKTLVELLLNNNHIEELGGQILLNSGAFDPKSGNTTLQSFTVDINMPSDLFNSLLRSGGGKKKGKGKGGKKKKKK